MEKSTTKKTRRVNLRIRHTRDCVWVRVEDRDPIDLRIKVTVYQVLWVLNLFKKFYPINFHIESDVDITQQ